jgi:hypothetical protein
MLAAYEHDGRSDRGQPIAAVMDWKKQRRLWRELTGNSSGRR